MWCEGMCPQQYYSWSKQSARIVMMLIFITNTVAMACRMWSSLLTSDHCQLNFMGEKFSWRIGLENCESLSLSGNVTSLCWVHWLSPFPPFSSGFSFIYVLSSFWSGPTSQNVTAPSLLEIVQSHQAGPISGRETANILTFLSPSGPG